MFSQGPYVESLDLENRILFCVKNYLTFFLDKVSKYEILESVDPVGHRSKLC
ncbi:hypothetical protein CLV98_10887 [Dyadobacter jejuensis]|uniref:Uncharacterized protein n=1 Tax=Dyadobacter jejuensis TaxID=1082580 RepID=A0A316B3M7_9BACT|nr:hypothetical protein CLV98_10887 [Dyadobacter jejuensis]